MKKKVNFLVLLISIFFQKRYLSLFTAIIHHLIIWTWNIPPIFQLDFETRNPLMRMFFIYPTTTTAEIVNVSDITVKLQTMICIHVFGRAFFSLSRCSHPFFQDQFKRVEWGCISRLRRQRCLNYLEHLGVQYCVS